MMRYVLGVIFHWLKLFVKIVSSVEKYLEEFISYVMKIMFGHVYQLRQISTRM